MEIYKIRVRIGATFHTGEKLAESSGVAITSFLEDLKHTVSHYNEFAPHITDVVKVSK